MSARMHDASPDLPEITNQELDEWLAATERSGRVAYNLQWNKYQGVLSGDLPPESFDPAQFESLKRTLAITSKMRTMFAGIFGQRPGPTPEDYDDEFFRIISTVYGYDVTKGEPTS